MATIEFNNDSVRKVAETAADLIAVLTMLIWVDLLLGFDVIPQFLKTLVAWPTLIAVAWLGWKFVRGHQWFK